LLLPFLVPQSQDNVVWNSPFGSQVAFAGHIVVNGTVLNCDCHTTALCECDEGEEGPTAVPPNQRNGTDEPEDPKPPTPDETDPGTLALLVVLALLAWRFGR